ncbi:MAG: hypothetical protein IKG00_08065 [Lachnospiraceae bacterium]|nr:hypothetical protein [Lachnospiraceae bacterium]
MNRINCNFNDIAERDMDLLLAEELASSGEFLQIFTDVIKIDDAHVETLYISKTDIQLGESDLTIVINSDGVKSGLLIEDKIDAVAMPDQACRYFKRGEKGVKDNEYDQFFIFIVAPQKYLDLNSEAKKYQYQISYERILEFFEQFVDARSRFKASMIRAGIEKQKRGYQVKKDDAVTEFWDKYDEYQKANYPELKPYYKKGDKGSNAAWPRFNTIYDGLYMYHKTNAGYVDLTFDRCANKIVTISEILAEHLRNYQKEGLSIHKTGKSAALRLNVPVLDMQRSFEEQLESVEACFKAIKKMTDTAELFSLKEIINLLAVE